MVVDDKPKKTGGFKKEFYVVMPTYRAVDELSAVCRLLLPAATQRLVKLHDTEEFTQADLCQR